MSPGIHTSHRDTVLDVNTYCDIDIEISVPHQRYGEVRAKTSTPIDQKSFGARYSFQSQSTNERFVYRNVRKVVANVDVQLFLSQKASRRKNKEWYEITRLGQRRSGGSCSPPSKGG